MLVTLFVEVAELEKFDGQRKERGKGVESSSDDKTGFIYKGLSPHKFAPMSQAYTTASSRCSEGRGRCLIYISESDSNGKKWKLTLNVRIVGTSLIAMLARSLCLITPIDRVLKRR